MSEVAIIGVGCLFPGADNVNEFWRVLRNGENHVKEVPPDRWNLEAFYDSDPDVPGKTHVRQAGFVDGYDKWDFKVYGVNEFEARKMDPQHKFVLDSTFMALENAGISKQQISGSKTGVYIGMFGSDYGNIFSTIAEESDNYTLTGTSNSIVAARVSYVFNLTGPSMVIDTACSSSLVSIHLACQALRSGECDMAIAGGVNSLMKPDIFIQLSKAGMVSPTGKCQAFSENADGYARGEGCGIIILKPLEKALNDNDPIWATIVTAVNHDGQTVTPITTPSPQQQESLLDTVFDRYRIDPESVDYIEAHGTGTKAGDPVEVTALGKFFQKDKNPKQRLIGSVKTNIGHLESGAGVAGLIKVLLMHKHQKIVPSLHFDKPSENVPLEKYKLTVPTEVQPWPKNDNGYMRSCVNSFSFGGTNSHAIITTPMNPSNEPEKYDTSISQLPRIVCLSACDRTSLQMIKSNFCNTGEGYNIEDVSYTTMYRRNHFPFRIAVIGTNMKQVIQRLNENDLKDKHSIDAVPKKKKIILVFAGMGTNWKGMCQSLLKHSAIFRGTINDVSDILKQFISWDLCDAFENGFDLDDPYVAPIMTFACEIGVYAMMKEFGVVADAIVGQSIGEVAAAYASGALTLNQAVCVIYHRTKYQAEATGGKMFIVRNMEIADVNSLIETFKSQANISLFYSPSCCTISCDDEVIGLIKSRLKETERRVEFIDLNVTSAFHSHHMDDCTEKLTNAFILHGTPPTTPIVSSVSGKMAVGADFITSEYWAKNIRNPVLFHQSIVEVHEPDKMNIFIEIGPKPILKAHLRKIFEQPLVAIAIPTIQKDDEMLSIKKAATSLYENGVNIKWEDVLKCSGKVIEVPQYQFNRVPNCYIPNIAREILMGVNSKMRSHPFLKSLVSDPRNYKILLDPSRIASVYEHKVNGIVMIPGALYAEVGIAIAATKSSRLKFKEINVDFKTPLVLKNRESKELDVETEDINQEIHFRIFEGTTVYATGSIKSYSNGSAVDKLDLDDIRSRCNILLKSEDMYADLATYGFQYGQAMTILQGAVKNNKEALVEFKLNELLKEEMEGTILHPAIIDGLLQTPGAFGSNDDNVELLPSHLNQVRVLREVQDHMFCYVKLQKITPTKLTCLIHLCAENGDIIASILKFTVKSIGINREKAKEYFYKQQWKKVSLVDEPTSEYKTDIIFITAERHLDECPSLIVPENNAQRQKLLANFSTQIKKHKNIAIMMDEFRNQIIDGRDIQTVVEIKLLWLRDILIHIHENTENCRVLVITRNTWTVTTDKSNCVETSNCNPIQVSIWGFLRSVQRETMSFKLHIVDLNDYNDQISKTRILEFLIDGVSNNLKNQGEILVTAGAVYSFECTGFDRIKDYIERDKSSLGDFEIFSSQKDKIQNHFQMYPCYEEGNSNSNKVVMQVVSLVVQNPDLYSSSVDSLEKEDNEEPNEFPVCCLETLGYVGRQQTTDNKRSDIFISCYPVHASNRVKVPISCCVPISLLPCYHPGLITIFVTLWNICKHVTSKSVVLFCEDNTSLYEEIICLMLRYSKVKTITRASRNTNNLTNGCELINLTRLDRSIIFSHILNFSKVTRFISLSALMTRGCESLLCHHMQDSEIKVLRELDIFSPVMLTSTIPKMSAWLKKSTKDVNVIINKHGSYTKDAGHLTKLFSSQEINLDQPDVVLPLRLKPPNRILSKSAAYVVVGGLTGLGWQCVKWLAENNAGSIACFNRRSPTKDDERQMEELSHKCCCKIIAIQTDVTNFISLKVSFEKLMQQFPMSPPKGVIFGAGVLRDSTLINMTDKQITEVLDAKITGAWNMHLATENIELDFFILHSSITSVFGAPGQSNYGAGNAFQDSLALYRRTKGLPAQSINWGPLDMGMLENAKDNLRNRKRLENQGYHLICKDDIGHCLESAIFSDLPQIIVSDLNLQVLKTTLFSYKDMFAIQKIRGIFPKSVNYTELIDDTNSEKIQISSHVLQSTSTKERIPIIESYISQLVRKVLILDENRLSLNTCLVDEGMDSMLAMTIVNEVNKDISYKIPVNLLFSPDTTVASLSSFINENIRSSNEVDDEDNQDDIIDNPQNISYMEYRYYKLNQTPLAYKTFHLLFDMYFSDLSLNKETVANLLLAITARNPILRTTYSGVLREGGSKEDIKRNLIDAKQALDLIIIDEAGQDIDEAFEKKSMEHFDLISKGPVRFIYHTNGSSMRIAIICNHIAFDIQAVSMLLKEFINCLKSLYKYHSLEHLSIPASQNNRLAGNIMDRRLKSSFSVMKRFWTKELSKGVPLISIDSSKICDLHGLSVTSHRQISSELHNELSKLSKTLRTTTSKIMMSMYQLFLSLRCGNRRVFITLPEDLRSSLPETKNFMECLINHIPIFADIEHSMSVKDFLVTNSKHINDILDNSLFPYDEIVNLIPNDANRDLYRHVLTINDYTFVDQLTAMKDGAALKLKETNNKHIFGESFLFVFTDRNAQTTSFKLQLSKEMYSQSDVEIFIDQIIELLQEMVLQPEVKIAQLQETILQPQVKIVQPKLAAPKRTLEGKFRRETSTGGLKDVNVKFLAPDNDGVMVILDNKNIMKSDIKHFNFEERKKSGVQILKLETQKKVYKLQFTEGSAESWKQNLINLYKNL
ncbi:hypothetical protein SNE40_019127 [Patella caerulea]|uniref:Carrier domain-containing protein n=1 Tax=Patella caerulea TaxID=87958 RepID=A0AAN8J6I3_PATCE